MFVGACVIYLSYLSSFLGEGLAGQGWQNVTLYGHRARRVLKRVEKCAFWFGWRQLCGDRAR